MSLFKVNQFNSVFAWLIVTALCILQLSCSNKQSPVLVKKKQDFKPHVSTQNYFITDANIPPIIEPKVSDAISEPNQALFSISLRSVPIAEFLQALALDAEVDLLMNEGVVGVISLQMQNKTLQEILNAVVKQLPIRYELSESVLQVFSDDAYIKTYAVDYLNVQRSAASDIDLSTQIGAISLDSNSKTAGNNSRATVSNTSVNDFWLSLEANLGLIVANDAGVVDSSVIVNRETGLVTVNGKHRIQEEVEAYISKIVASAQRQVLIEALVIELVLSDRFQAGVDWRVLTSGGESGNYVQSFSGNSPVSSSNIQGFSAPNALFSLFKDSGSGNSITATMSLLREYGEVNILSSPKINALNNQPAVLKVVDNRVYFALDVKKVLEEDVETLTTTSEIKTVPIGLVMNVLPFISENKDIILNIRPTISRILGYASDPNPTLADAGVQNLVPEIQVREMESVLRVRSGGLVVIGGLMQDQVSEEEVSVPGLSMLPGLGNLFKYQKKVKTKTELLVLLRPTLIENQGSYNQRMNPYLH